MGIVHRELEDFHGAREIDREAADLASQVGGAWLPLALASRARDEAAMDRMEEAVALVAQARQVVDASQTQVESEEVVATECRIALQRGDVTVALQLASRLLALVDEHGAGHWWPMGLQLKAEALVAADDRDEAHKALVAAVEGAERMGASPVLWRALAGLAEWQLDAGDKAASANSARRARDIVERLAASVSDDRLRATFLQSRRVQRLSALAG